MLIPDLGADRTWRVTYDDPRGTLSVLGEETYASGSGPRHVVFHDDILYTVSEFTSNLFTHHLPPLPDPPKLLSTVSTLQLQPGEALGDRVAAELLLASALAMDARNSSSSYGPGDGAARRTPFLYATNRNDPSPEGDTVAIFSLDNRTAPARVTEVHTGLRHLRGAVIGGEDGRWMMLGGMLGGGVKMYERVDGGRSIKEIAALLVIEGLTGFLWIRPHVGV